MISSSSVVDIRALAPAVIEAAVAKAAAAEAEATATAVSTQASDSFTFSFRFSLASTSAAANSASSLQRVSSKKNLFCSCAIGDTSVARTCVVAVEPGLKEVVPTLGFFLRGIVASL